MRLEPRYKNENRVLVSLASGAVVSVSSLAAVDVSLGVPTDVRSAVGVVVGKSETKQSLTAAKQTEAVVCSIIAVLVPCSRLEIAENQYNEEYLAKLRDFLKAMEEKSIDVVIVPVTNDIFTDKSEKKDDIDVSTERFVATMLHTARRIKDCVSVAGFALPNVIANDEKKTTLFINALAAKHPQYVYFCCAEMGDKRLIPYSLR